MVIAAVLVGLLILLFLGSWRSTVIILIEIPLAILFALTALSWCGESMNVMTLGGLALAVGILVDDGTVTIENINYHLELGKAVVPAILDGAQQIVMPAFVTLLCLSIVFVPMFQLGGVAGYLFRPMAMAVVFALLGSFLLSRTLVPTMASYLIRAARGRDRSRAAAAPSSGRSSTRSGASRSASRRASCASASSTGRCSRSRSPIPRVHRRIPRLRRAVLRADAVPRPQLLPERRLRRDPDAHSRPWGHAHRADREAVRGRRARRAADHPAEPARQHHGEHRAALQRHQHGIPEHRHGRARRTATC